MWTYCSKWAVFHASYLSGETKKFKLDTLPGAFGGKLDSEIITDYIDRGFSGCGRRRV